MFVNLQLNIYVHLLITQRLHIMLFPSYSKNDRLGLGLGFTVFIATIITLTSLGLLIALLVTGHEVVNQMSMYE